MTGPWILFSIYIVFSFIVFIEIINASRYDDDITLLTFIFLLLFSFIPIFNIAVFATIMTDSKIKPISKKILDKINFVVLRKFDND